MNLAQKYEPKFLRDLVASHWLLKSIRRFVLSRSLEILLFIGPSGVGKTTLARMTAKLCVCTSFNADSPDACGKCDACKAYDAYPDLYVVKEQCSGDDTEALQRAFETARYHCVQPVSLLFIDEVGYANKNSLAVIHEQIDGISRMQPIPGRRFVLVLATTEEFRKKLSSSLSSRITEVTFPELTQEQVANRLQYIADKEGFVYEPEAIFALAEDTELGLRHSIKLLQQIVQMAGRVTQKEVHRITGMAPEEVYISVLRLLRRNPRKMFYRTWRLLLRSGVPGFIRRLCTVFHTLNTFSQGIQPRRMLSPKLRRLYSEAQKEFHPIELAYISDVLHSRRFQQAASRKAILDQLLSLRSRLASIQLTDPTAESIEDRIWRERNRRKRPRRRHK
ncbi:AAA family ATPase [Turneriella parva]|uniref:AAA ATPase central domain protein n=1 Tax=Turneriella parva (strain ATCC BAA-1111 / DSM 21527 / NCTC 11395 / H) TaxID=869212 RepID=I4BAA6_TURPD|nr:AAA family ATPase [Turneriella parva]AFM14213.1 AAA ATPase central domain protein [Turneriella parva DSM 21527]